MSYKVLYRKYRPANFSELVGQTTIKESLINSIIKNQLAHAYIFTGPRGTGKTSTAKIFAKTLSCKTPINGDCCGKCENCKSFNENPDIIEIDAASNNGVDEIREIRNNVKLVPTMSNYKIYIIDEVHMLSTSAWNAFLKTLEEPPKHVIFLFATTDIQKVPLTVLSRCQRYDFHKLNDEEIREHILSVSEKENISIADDAIASLVKLSDGCLRDCLSYLDQLSKISNEISQNMVSDVFGILSLEYIKNLLFHIQSDSIEDFMLEFDSIKEKGIDCNVLVNNMIDYLVNEATNIKLKKESFVKDFSFCKILINKLFEIQTQLKFVDNSFNLLLITLLDCFSQSKPEKKNISQDEKKKNISREIKSKCDDTLKQVRVNNVFINANKEYKKQFTELWNHFLSSLTEFNNYSILGYVSSMNIQVVSDEYVLFSTDLSSDSVVFNSNLELIELEFKKILRKEYKFISLSEEEWLIEKENFIKNKDKLREYIDEKNIISKNKEISSIESDAQDIFGDIIEVN